MTTCPIPGLAARLAPHGRFSVLGPLAGGHRNAAMLVEDPHGRRFVAKATRRSEAALAWAAALQAEAARCGIAVAAPRPAPDGRLSAGGLTLEPFVGGAAGTPADLAALGRPLARLRRATAGWPQRPGFASAADLLARDAGGDADLAAMPPALTTACRAAWTPLAGRRETAVHGDLTPSNLIRAGDGRLVLLDWDECRRDSPLLDRAALMGGAAPPALAQALLAWEVAVCWQVEPTRAKSLARQLAGAGSGRSTSGAFA